MENRIERGDKFSKRRQPKKKCAFSFSCRLTSSLLYAMHLNYFHLLSFYLCIFAKFKITYTRYMGHFDNVNISGLYFTLPVNTVKLECNGISLQCEVFFFILVFIECSHVKWCHIYDNLQTQPKLFPFLISMEFSKIKRKHPSKMFHSDYLILLFHAIPIYASCTVYNTLILIYMFRVSFFYFHFFYFLEIKLT